MKVLQVGKFYPPRWGGMETVLKDICETTQQWVELKVVVANEALRTVRENLAGIDLTRLASFGTWFSQPLVPGMVSLFRKTDADLVHLHEPNPLAIASYLMSGCKSRLVIHYHSDIVRQRRLRLLYRPLLNLALAKADSIVVGSSQLMESSPVLAPFRSKCVVIPFGIDLAPFLAVPGRPSSTAEPLILAVGRLSYYKGFQYLIEAMSDLPARLSIVGEGEMRPELEKLIRDRDLEGRVRLEGKVEMEELLAWYGRADLFCLPSCHSSEAFGLVLVEAMAAGLPVVSTNLPTGVRAVNVHRETGLVAQAGQTASLREALATLIQDPQLRGQMGVRGRARALELFNRERMGQQILALYNAVSAGHAPSKDCAIAKAVTS
ncbi:MAG: glycosyltransferase [Acidobacteriia bacterium]|nr:glycosyltransferase [Terriglobia bacterium]